MIPFPEASYRSQVRRLKTLAVVAIARYPIRVKSIKFINHGENATFKITARGGSKYLLRIHRGGYHTEPALNEEVRWLEKLSKAGLKVPVPVKSRRGKLIEKVSESSVGTRHCDVFRWTDGRFLSKSISESDMYKIGVLLAKIQQVGRSTESKHRRYWTSEGLVGAKPKFGSVKDLEISQADKKKLIREASRIFGKLKRYERKHPHKMGVIHADLHFGNLLKTSDGEIAAIDFDDCGHGFYIYDLMVPLMSVAHHLREHKRLRDYKTLKASLIAGYSSETDFSEDDLQLLHDLGVARQLMMLGWLHSRSDNPRLKKYLKKRIPQVLKYIKKPLL